MMNTYYCCYYDNARVLKNARLRGYDAALSASGIHDNLRLRFASKVRAAKSLAEVESVIREIFAYRDAVWLIASYEEA